MAEKICTHCSESTPVVPYAAVETLIEKHEAERKRWIVLVIISWIVTLIVFSLSTYERLQYDYISEEIVCVQDGEGLNIFGNENEVISNGAEGTNNEKN